MSRRNPPAKWVLPITVYPENSLCVTIPVPDETFYKAAFWGAMLDLASAYKWQDDTAHTARLVANVWRTIVDDLAFTDCTVPPQGVEFDGEELMGSLCEALRFENGVLQAFCCGEWVDIPGAQNAIQQGASQPPAGGTIPTNECKTVSVVLNGRDRFLIPYPVDDGYTITITNAQGGWWNGDVLQAWECPSGDTYALGVCVSAGSLDPSNPVPGLPYGRLIAQVGSAWLDADNTSITVPSGTGPVDVYLQMNDSNLADNQGSISFDVSVCATPPAMYSHLFNFALGPLGWTGVSLSGGAPTWDGTQWQGFAYMDGGCGGNNNAVQNTILLSVPTPTYVTSVRIVLDSNGDWGPGNGDRQLTLDGGTPISLGLNTSYGPQDVTIPVNAMVSTSIQIEYNSICFAVPVWTEVKSATVNGNGTDVF